MQAWLLGIWHMLIKQVFELELMSSVITVDLVNFWFFLTVLLSFGYIRYHP